MVQASDKLNKFNGLRESFRREFSDLVLPDLMQTGLWEVCAYSLFPPGKCIRAALSLYVAQILDVPRQSILGVASAIEVIHAASLVHDDLPALDNDELRRGQPTVHKKHGEAAAVLAGDALIILSGIVLEDLSKKHQVSADIRLELANLLQRTFLKVCDGQFLDLQASGTISAGLGREPISPEQELLDRHSLKTASLIQAASLAPVCFLEQEQRSRFFDVLSDFGMRLGLLFQITDDILEATSGTKALGKSVDSDTRKGTPTYVSVHGLEASQKIASDLSAEGLSMLASCSELEDLGILYELVLNRKS